MTVIDQVSFLLIGGHRMVSAPSAAFSQLTELATAMNLGSFYRTVAVTVHL